MKKIILPLLFFAVSSIYGQFGVRAGIEFPTVKTSNTSDSYSAFFGGLFYDIKISDKFSVRPEIDYLSTTTENSLIDNAFTNGNVNLKSQVQVVFPLKYNFTKGIYAYAATTLTYWLNLEEDVESENSLGFKFGTGFKLLDGVSLEASYDIIGALKFEQSQQLNNELEKRSIQLSLITSFDFLFN